MSEQNKIAKTLSAEQLASFLERCRTTPALTLQRIADLFAEFSGGEKVSLMGASAFRDTTFSKHLQRISKAAEVRELMREATRSGNSTAEAAALIVSDEVLDQLVNRDPDDPIDLDTLSKIIKRLRDSDTNAAALRHRIEQDQWNAAETAIKRAREIRIIDQDKSMNHAGKVESVRRLLFGAPPQTSAPALGGTGDPPVRAGDPPARIR